MTLSEALIIDLMMVKGEHLGQLLRYLRGRRVSRTMCHVNFIVWRRIVQCMPPQSNLYPTLKLKSRNETSKCRKKWLATRPHAHTATSAGKHDVIVEMTGAKEDGSTDSFVRKEEESAEPDGLRCWNKELYVLAVHTRILYYTIKLVCIEPKQNWSTKTIPLNPPSFYIFVQ